MTKWDKVAEILGVAVGDEFRLVGGFPQTLGKLYRFTPKGIVSQSELDEEKWVDEPYFPLIQFIRQGWRCMKVSYKPKEFDAVWVAVRQTAFGETLPPTPVKKVWYDDAVCHVAANLGLVYRTREDCEAKMKADYERITGEKWKW